MIDILMPTFNRAEFIEKNILLLNEQIVSNGILDKFRLIVSNNCSSDNTIQVLDKISKKIEIEMIIFNQDENIGLEKNSIFLLEKSQSEFIMYLGDDDYIPNDYLKFSIDTIERDTQLSAIIPGFSAFYSDGSIAPTRNAPFDIKYYLAGLNSTVLLSSFGHQLSGLVLKRKNLLDKYIENNDLRNMYPFIFFLAYNTLHGNCYYAPKYQVLVSQSNSKDWSYDASGLLIDVLKNYTILFPTSLFKRWLCGVTFIVKQSWRLRVGKNLNLAWKAFSHLEKSEHIDPLMKLSLPFIYGYSYARLSLVFFKNRLIKQVKN